MRVQTQVSEAREARERGCQLLQAVSADAVLTEGQVREAGEAAERWRERGGAGGAADASGV